MLDRGEVLYFHNMSIQWIKKRKTDHTGGKTVIEQYVYRDEDIVFRIIVDSNTGEWAVNQVYAHGELAVDDPVAFSDCPNAVCSSGGWSFLGKDQVQSVESIFNPDTFTNQTQYYSTFGISLTTSSIPSGFTSREQDTRNIMYFRRRYYKTNIGLFSTHDPVDRVLNKYIYAANNPIRLFDPFGMKEKENKECPCSYKFKIDKSCRNQCQNVKNAIDKACNDGVKRAPARFKNMAECVSKHCNEGYTIFKFRHDVYCAENGENNCDNNTCARQPPASNSIILCPKFFKMSSCEQGNIFYHEILHFCGYIAKETYGIANASFPECKIYPGDCSKKK